MGGAAGHMSHIYEDLDLTFGDLKQILKDIVDSKVELFEKIDGQNLFVTFDPDAGKIFAARNLTDIRKGGSSAEEFLSRWEGHPASKPFTEGFTALEQILRRLSGDVAQKVFIRDDAGKLPFLNLEIVCSTHPNLIQYDKNFLVFHSLDTGDATSFSLLVSALSGKRATVNGEEWEVSGPRSVKINISNSKIKALDTAILKIDELGMSDSSTIADYVAEKLRANIVSEIPVTTVKQESIINLVLGKPAMHTIASLKKDESQVVQKIISSLCTQENARKARGVVLRPIENIITDFSAEILDSESSTLVDDHARVISQLKQDVIDSIAQLKKLADTGDLATEKLLDKQMSKLRSVDNINTSMEGVVFKHPASETTYKMTGTFAMANQIVGHARRSSV